MRSLTEDLGARGVQRLMVEGGGKVHTQFLTDNLVDELQLVVAPFFVGDSRATRFVSDGRFPWNPGRRATLADVRQIGDVVLLRYALSPRFRDRLTAWTAFTGQDQQVGVVHGDRELPGCRLRQTSARVVVGLGRQLDLLLARSTHPSGEPLRRQLGLRRRRVARGWAGRGPRRPVGRTPRRRARPRQVRAGGPAPSGGVGGHQMRQPRGGPADPPGSRSTRPTTDSVSRIGHPAPAQTVTSSANSSSVSRSSSAEAVMRVAPARSPGCSRVMSEQLRLDGYRGPVGGRAGEVGGGDLQQVCVPVVQDPVLRPRQQWREPAAHRAGAAAEVVDHPDGRSPGAARPRCSTRSRARAAASAGSRRASHALLTRMPSALIATPRPGPPRRRTSWSTSRASDSRRSRAARRSRPLSSASPSQARSAAASAAASSGATSSPGRIPAAP